MWGRHEATRAVIVSGVALLVMVQPSREPGPQPRESGRKATERVDHAPASTNPTRETGWTAGRPMPRSLLSDRAGFAPSTTAHPLHGTVDHVMETAGVSAVGSNELERLMDWSADMDPELAQHAQTALAYAMQQLTISDAPLPPNTAPAPNTVAVADEDTYPALKDAAISVDADLASITRAADYERAMSLALDDTDLETRMRVITEASTRKDDIGIKLLAKALSDSDARIRAMAVDGLREILEQGLTDAEGILPSFERIARDPDVAVSDAVGRILTDYGGVQRAPTESLPRPGTQ
jgi:hypothetical protein